MKIVTDSAADLTPEDIREYEITVAPLFINFPEGEVRADEMTPDQFYSRLEAMQPDTPKTAQPSPEIFSKLYEKLIEGGQDVLSIHISSGLSGTFNSARIGAEKFNEKAIHVIDSMTLSGGQRFQIVAAAKAVKAGWPAEKIKEQLEKVRTATEVVYTLETLDYLARGGRIGRVQALASSLLNIKPIIQVSKEDGKYSTVGKSRTIKRAIADMVAHIVELYKDQSSLWVSVVHGQFEDKAMMLAEMLQNSLQVGKLEILRISPVLGVHTGPGIVGVTIVPLRLIEEIQ